MMIIRRVLCFLLVLTRCCLSQKTEGDTCVVEHTNTIGKCTRAENCHTAREGLQLNGIKPTFCAYTFDGALVCCRDGSSILQVASPTPAAQDYRPVWGSGGDATTYNSKRVSEKKCLEYSRGVIQTVNFLPLLPDGQPQGVSFAKCDYSGLELIIGGETALPGEFPHMALIGWVNFEDTYTFACGGSLISPRFVLTAGHCVNSPRFKDPKPAVVRLADHNIDPSVNDGANPVEVPIKKIHRHPDYKPPQRYNDIALLELATNVDFDASVRPACLWMNDHFDGNTNAIATGWGVHDIRTKETSSELMKVSLSLYSNEYCDRLLVDNRNRNWQGFRDSQMCAGELRGGKDTCQGDSGGPLQLASKDNQCIFYIVGVTSFGNKCAERGQPAIYTRVASFLDWIETVVWPGEN